MSLQISFLIECLATIFKRTHEVLNAIVLLYMDVESLYTTVGVEASLNWTLVRLYLLVRLHVILQVAFRHEVLGASFEVTFKWSTVLTRSVKMELKILTWIR